MESKRGTKRHDDGLTKALNSRCIAKVIFTHILYHMLIKIDFSSNVTIVIPTGHRIALGILT